MFIFGEDVAGRVGYTLAAPIRIVFWIIIVLPIRIVCWPFTYRNNRLFREEFGKSPDQSSHERVNERLKKLAEDMQDAFDRQEQARIAYRPRHVIVLEEVNATAEQCKAAFWRAHALAVKEGFAVAQDRYTFYLMGVQG